MEFLQEFHLIIIYNIDNNDWLEDVLSRPPTPKIKASNTLMYMESFTHDAYKKENIDDEDFKGVFQ
jgi:hypothetical protein